MLCVLCVCSHFTLCINSITAISEPRRSLARGWPRDPASVRRLNGADFRHQVYRLQCTPGSSCQRRFTTYRIGFVLLWWPSHTQVLFSGALDSPIMLYRGESVTLMHYATMNRGGGLQVPTNITQIRLGAHEAKDVTCLQYSVLLVLDQMSI